MTIKLSKPQPFDVWQVSPVAEVAAHPEPLPHSLSLIFNVYAFNQGSTKY